MFSIGVISDTHGLLRPSAIRTLEGTDCLIHAGDVGKEEILQQLAEIAPVVTVRGNVDRAPWTERLPLTAAMQVGGVSIYVLHDLHALTSDPASAGIRVVISGHSHQPGIRGEEGVLYLNPGSAGPRRFRLPITVARLEIDDAGRVAARIIELAA